MLPHIELSTIVTKPKETCQKDVHCVVVFVVALQLVLVVQLLLLRGAPAQGSRPWGVLPEGPWS